MMNVLDIFNSAEMFGEVGDGNISGSFFEKDSEDVMEVGESVFEDEASNDER